MGKRRTRKHNKGARKTNRRRVAKRARKTRQKGVRGKRTRSIEMRGGASAAANVPNGENIYVFSRKYHEYFEKIKEYFKSFGTAYNNFYQREQILVILLYVILDQNKEIFRRYFDTKDLTDNETVEQINYEKKRSEETVLQFEVSNFKEEIEQLIQKIQQTEKLNTGLWWDNEIKMYLDVHIETITIKDSEKGIYEIDYYLGMSVFRNQSRSKKQIFTYNELNVVKKNLHDYLIGLDEGEPWRLPGQLEV